jgi:hypothetical protein
MIGPVELAPGEFVDFIPQCGNPQLPERFLKTLKEAWQKVPASARRTILDYYHACDHWYPRVILGTRIGSISPIARGGGKNDGYMAWFDSLALLEMPGKEPWILAVIGEELAHAFLLASQDPTHISDPPNEDRESPEYQAWNNAREEAMKKVLHQWPFDPDAHARIISWLQSKQVLKTPSAVPK